VTGGQAFLPVFQPDRNVWRPAPFPRVAAAGNRAYNDAYFRPVAPRESPSE
jgi:hypothetical protein